MSPIIHVPHSNGWSAKLVKINVLKIKIFIKLVCMHVSQIELFIRFAIEITPQLRISKIQILAN